MSRESLEYWKHFLSRIDKHLHTEYDSGKPHQTLLNAQHLPEDGDILPDYDKIERPEVDPWTGRDNPSNPASAFKAPEATQIERPVIEESPASPYMRRVEVYKEAYLNPLIVLETDDSNLAERVVKAITGSGDGESSSFLIKIGKLPSKDNPYSAPPASERVQVDAYSTDAYEARIDLYREALEGTVTVEADQSNLAERVQQAFNGDLSGESTWFINKVKE